MPKHTNPQSLSRLALHVGERIRALSGAKSQKKIAREAGFANSNVLSMLKSGDTKLALDRAPALAKSLETDARLLFLAERRVLCAPAARAAEPRLAP